MARDDSTLYPPEEPTSPTAHWHYLVWQFLPTDGRWHCIAAFAHDADANTFIANQAGRVGYIYCQTPYGVAVYPQPLEPRNTPA